VRSAGSWAGATLALLAELGSLAALAFWGFTVPPAGAVRVLLGVGLPAAAAVLWGMFAAPRAVVRVRALAVLTVVAVQGGAVAALAVAGRPWSALALGVAAAAGRVLSALWPLPAGDPTRTGRGPHPGGGPPTA
jgi:hypothetical protein